MTNSFDSLYTNLISEMMPVGSEFGDFSSSLEKGIGSAPGDAYLIGAIAKALDISKEEVVKNISKSLYDKVFGETGVNPANSEEEYRSSIADALTDIIQEIKVGHPDAKIPGAAAIRGYTSRVISGLATATKEFGEKATETDVESAVEEASAEEVEVGSTEEGPVAEKPVQSGKPSAPASFKAGRDYYLKNREEIPAGTLKGDLQAIYDRLSGIAGEVTTGSDIEKALRKGGTDQGRIASYLRKLVEVGVLEPAEEEGGGKGEGFADQPEEDMRSVERSTFDKELGHAYKDYMSSGGGGNGYGVDFG
jgi:hypothetical protein